MNFPIVSHYAARFQAHEATPVSGYVALYTTTNEEHHLGPLPPEAFHALVELLRNERPIFFDPQSRTVLTGRERIGEEEID